MAENVRFTPGQTPKNASARGPIAGARRLLSADAGLECAQDSRPHYGSDAWESPVPGSDVAAEHLEEHVRPSDGLEQLGIHGIEGVQQHAGSASIDASAAARAPVDAAGATCSSARTSVTPGSAAAASAGGKRRRTSSVRPEPSAQQHLPSSGPLHGPTVSALQSPCMA